MANTTATTRNGTAMETPTKEKAQDDQTDNAVSETEGGHKFQQAIAAWRALDLTKLVSNLDTTAEELVTHQKDALVQRKELAQKTKDFRKLDDAQKLVDIKDLLKAYQSYVDVLTNHSKSVTSAFMQAYSPLSEAPDPYPLLEASVDSLVTSEELVPKLEAENQRLQKQVSKLTTQIEDSEKQVEEQRSKRETNEASQDAKIKDVEKSWTAVLQEKEENWTAKEKSLEEKVDNQERLLRELKASYEVNQRLEKSGEEVQDVGRSTAYAAELEITNSELEKGNIRLADLESRNEQLRLELAQTTSQFNSSARSTAVEDDPAYLRLRSENSSLLRRLDASKETRETEKSKIESKLRAVERELAALKVDRDSLQSKVNKWSDYEEVKREAEMLRAIEFATVDDDSGQAESGTQQNGSTSASLEKLLVARNKKLSDDLTELRVSHNELQQRVESLQDDLSSTNMQLEKTQLLNATLENDLQRTQQEVSNAFDTMSVAGTYTSRYPKSSYGSRRGAGTSPTSSIIGGYEPSTSFRGAEGPGSGSGILPMVTAQRDRFKKKISELELELQKQYQTVTALRSEISSLQRDNLNLYEKTRYVSSYNRNSNQGTSGASYIGNPNPSTIHVSDSQSTSSGLSLDRYRSAYESSLSPFAAFRGRESARVLRGMTLPERVVFRITKMVLATRASRNLFAAYCLGLHVLIFMMLFWSGSDSITQGASHLGSSVAAADPARVLGGDAADHGDWKQQDFHGDKFGE